MPNRSPQSGVSLVEIAAAIIIFAFIVTSAIYGLRVVQETKIKAFIIQVNHTAQAADMFKSQYGSMPGDFAQATTRLKNCDATHFCVNGDGDGTIGGAGGCAMPPYQDNDAPFPCANINSETAQFWRHLGLAHMTEGYKMTNRYVFGHALPKSRIAAGLQVIYNGDINNQYVTGLRGHFFVLQNSPTLLHRSLFAVGDAIMMQEEARRLDTEMDDGFPNTGNFRTIGQWGCGGWREINEYRNDQGSQNRQCSIFYKFDKSL